MISSEGVRLVWLDIDYKNRELVPDATVVRMLAAIRVTIFDKSSRAQTTAEGYSVAMTQLRQIMAASRGARELFERAGYSLEEAIEVLQMLDAIRD